MLGLWVVEVQVCPAPDAGQAEHFKTSILSGSHLKFRGILVMGIGSSTKSLRLVVVEELKTDSATDCQSDISFMIETYFRCLTSTFG
jgi:hypothetical protein